MSRLAKKSIPVPAGVSVGKEKGSLLIVGTKGAKTLPLLSFVKVEIGEGSVKVVCDTATRQGKANCGTMWSLLKNAIRGVAEEFQKILEIEGVGYRAAIEGSTLVLYLGYVEPVRFPVPEGVRVVVEKNVVAISGLDKDLVGRVAARIRALKKPEPYKGKGIHYRGEVIRRKVGKKAAAGAGTGTQP